MQEKKVRGEGWKVKGLQSPFAHAPSLCALVCLSPAFFVLLGCVSQPSPVERPGLSTVAGVLYVGDEPASGVRVLAGGTSHQTSTDAAGRFDILGVTPGRYRIVLTGGGRSHVLPVVVPPDTRVELGDITITPEGLVMGRPKTLQPASASTLQEVALQSGVQASILESLAAEMGIDVSAWERFLDTGELPQRADQRFTRKDLLRLVRAAREQISATEAEAVLASLTGLTPDELRALYEEQAVLVPTLEEGGLSQATLAASLRSLRDSGKLDGHLLDALRVEELGYSEQTEAPAGESVLYDGSLETLPEEQGWWWLTAPFAGQATQHMLKKAVVLNSMGERRDKAGFFTQDPVAGDFLQHPRLPVLDRRRGFTLHMQMAVRDEKHVRDDRAGFSIIVVCEDLKAIELGFWKDRVWAQGDDGKPLFEDSRAESVMLDTSRKVVAYHLEVRQDAYELLVQGRPILAGPLRDYTAFGGYPYDVPSFIFLGDNTTSARAATELLWLSVTHEPGALPETASLEPRDAARRIAAGTSLNPIEALAWIEDRGEGLSPGADGLISRQALDEAALAAWPESGGTGTGHGPLAGSHGQGGHRRSKGGPLGGTLPQRAPKVFSDAHSEEGQPSAESRGSF